MSLLNRGTEVVTVYPEELVFDSDGNKLTRPSEVGVVVKVSVQPIESIADSEKNGATTSKYWLRLVGYPGLLGAQSAVEWQGRRYAIDGDPRIYNGSRRTAHAIYTIVRS